MNRERARIWSAALLAAMTLSSAVFAADKPDATPKPDPKHGEVLKEAAPAVPVIVLPTTVTWKKIKLTDQFFGEGAAVGDFNHDGKMDIVSGPYWYEGPDFSPEKKHSFYEPKAFDPHGYSKNFLEYVYDFNGDGWDDVLVYGFPGEDASWYENPKGATDKPWERHKILNVVDNESPTFQDIDGDGKPDIICSSGGFLGYATADWKEPAKPWTFHKISPKGPWQRFTHGIGIGDVNGDGKMDLLEKDGWWEQPKDLKGDPEWVKHAAKFGSGGAQMYAYDVNGDGRNDVVTSLAAHGYGLAWFEQKADGSFEQHTIMGPKPEDNAQHLVFSQLHAIDLIDIDGDGIKDIVTGKRYWAHGPTGDAEPGAPAVVYWFKLTRKDGKAEFTAHLIDNDSGVGTQVMAADVNGDKRPDIIVGNKKGTFVHIQQPPTQTSRR